MKFEELRKLHQKRYRDELGYFLVEGEHLVLELQKAATGNPHLTGCELYVTKDQQDWRSLFPTHVISSVQMSQLSETRTPQGIVALVPALRPPPPHPGEQCIYLYEIQDPGNLGTILRTLAWFGALRCLLSPGSVDPYNSKVVRASMGALFHVPVEVDVDIGSLDARFARVAALDMTGEPVQAAAFRNFDCYLFGNEARGLPPEAFTSTRAQAFTIGGGGAIDSLNLASAVNICMYELRRDSIGPTSVK